MDISELKRKKKEAGMTNARISELTGIPVSTVNKIFSGATKNPRYATLLAIEEALAVKHKLPFTYDSLREEPMMVRESGAYQYSARPYRQEDWEALSGQVRAELIRSRLYMMAGPNRLHQKIVQKMSYAIEDHIRRNQGCCEVYPAPFDVCLSAEGDTCVQPDLSVICRPEILTDQGCTGAPDWIIEVASPANSDHDYITKLMLYQRAGVREYWIIDPGKEQVFVYNFEDALKTETYDFTDPAPSGVLSGLTLCLSELLA